MQTTKSREVNPTVKFTPVTGVDLDVDSQTHALILRGAKIMGTTPEQFLDLALRTELPKRELDELAWLQLEEARANYAHEMKGTRHANR
jgi:hypothetical protein